MFVSCLLLVIALPAAADLPSLSAEYLAADATRAQRLSLIAEIADLGHDRAHDFLVDQLLDERDPILKRALFRTVDGALSLLPARVVRQTITDSDPYLRFRTLETIAMIGDSAAVERARSVLTYDEDPRVRGVAIRFLGTIGDVRSTRFVLETCAQLSYRDQKEAIGVLAHVPASVFAAVFSDNRAWVEDEKNGPLRLMSTLVLAAKADKNDARLLRELLHDDDRIVAFSAGLALDRISGRGAGAGVQRALQRTKLTEERVRMLTIVEQMAIPDPGLTKLLTSELKQKDWTLRAAAAGALGVVGDIFAVDPLFERYARDKIWQVKVACIEALGKTRRPEVVPRLIDLLDKTTGRLLRTTRLALARLTGVDLGEKSTPWRQWWEKNIDFFEPPPLSTVEWIDRDPTADKYAFYGLEITSDRVAFVLDVSGSMQGGKMALLKKELGRVIESLPATARFNMIFFNQEVSAWQQTSKPMTRKNRAGALDAVRYMEADGATNLWGAMMTAMTDPQIDSIYLLSDGQPTAGEIVDLGQICRLIGDRNRTQRIAIHVVMIGVKSAELRRLAVESGGSYIEA